MTDPIIARILADAGVLDLSGPVTEYVRGEHCDAAERARERLVTQLQAAQNVVGFLLEAVEVNAGDACFDAIDRLFGRCLNAAGTSLGEFRELRECVGEA